VSTGIQWTDETWNPVVGCTKVSQGCKNCYAKTVHDNRHKALLDGKKMPEQYREPFETVQLMPDRLPKPLSWKKPRKVFVNSVSDLFHEDVPFPFIAAVFGVMAYCNHHTFQVLTKRPERMREFMEWVDAPEQAMTFRELYGEKAGQQVTHLRQDAIDETMFGQFCDWTEAKGNTVYLDACLYNDGVWPLPNVWLGTSVEDQAAADTRIPELLATPAAVRFLSCEPLLSQLDLEAYLPKLDWLITGGESGAKARPCDVVWIRNLISDCAVHDVPIFVKFPEVRS